jgi:hypothetical protein
MLNLYDYEIVFFKQGLLDKWGLYLAKILVACGRNENIQHSKPKLQSI